MNAVTRLGECYGASGIGHGDFPDLSVRVRQQDKFGLPSRATAQKTDGDTAQNHGAANFCAHLFFLRYSTFARKCVPRTPTIPDGVSIRVDPGESFPIIPDK